jgi:hypothetical protein
MEEAVNLAKANTNEYLREHKMAVLKTSTEVDPTM